MYVCNFIPQKYKSHKCKKKLWWMQSKVSNFLGKHISSNGFSTLNKIIFLVSHMYWLLTHISKNVIFSTHSPPPPTPSLSSQVVLLKMYTTFFLQIQIYHNISTHKLLVQFSVTWLTVLATLTPYLFK